MSLWYGTPDARAPNETVQAGKPVAITIGVSYDPGNRVEVHYSVNQEKTEVVPANWLRNDTTKRAQYFQARLPAFRAGDKVEYTPICRCAGRQVPSADQEDQFPSSFQVIAVEEKRISSLASRPNLFLPTSTPMETQA